MATTKRLVGSIKSTSADTKAPYGSFDAILSMPTLDRDLEVIDAFCFNPLPEHITIDIDHAMSVEKTVASGRPEYDSAGTLHIRNAQFASTPLAQMTRTLVDEGHIKTVSVAFHPDPRVSIWELDKADGKMHLRKSELLNAGIVGIPSNREAVITAVKNLDQNSSTKAAVGSYEALSSRLRDALRELWPMYEYVQMLATFADSVVYCVGDEEEMSTYQTEYTIDANELVVFGQTVEVTLTEIVVQKTVNTEPAKKSAAPAAADVAPVEVARAKANASLTLALAALAVSTAPHTD